MRINSFLRLAPVLWAAAGYSQQQYPVDHIVDAAVKGAQAAELRSRARLTQAEEERIRLETQILRERLRLLSPLDSERSCSPKPSDGDLVRSWIRLQNRIPDIHLYRGQVENLMRTFASGEVSLDQYLEGLYVIAKYASFSPRAAAASPPRQRPIEE